MMKKSRKLHLWLTQLTCASGACCSECSNELGVANQGCQPGSDGPRIAGRGEDAAICSYDLGTAADARSHYRQSGVQGFDKGNSERLGARVGLAEDVCRGQQMRHIRALSEEAHPGCYPSVPRRGPQLGEVPFFSRPLCTAHHPALPVRQSIQAAQGIEQHCLTLPVLQAAHLQEDNSVRGRTELAADFGSCRAHRWRRYRQIPDCHRYTGEGADP